MNDRFKERMQQPQVRKDSALMGDFVQAYCKGNHADRDTSPMKSDGVSLDVYGKRIPVVCDECAEFLAYCEKRRAFCPQDPKPFCSYCEIHCYSPEMSEKAKEIMRYAGPRSIRSRHAVASMKHAIDGMRAKRNATKKP